MRPFAADSGGGVLALVVVYAGAYVTLVFAALCLAAGFYYVAELIEEHSRLAKRVISTGLRVLLALHLLLLLEQPWQPVLLSAAAHGSYTRLLPRFPAVSLSSPATLLAALLFVCSSALWCHHFYYATYASLFFVLGFLCIVSWLAPVVLLLSLASDGAPGLVLPTGALPPFAAAALAREAAAARARGDAPPAPGEGRRRRNLVVTGLRGVMAWVRGAQEEPGRRE